MNPDRRSSIQLGATVMAEKKILCFFFQDSDGSSDETHADGFIGVAADGMLAFAPCNDRQTRIFFAKSSSAILASIQANWFVLVNSSI